MPLFFFDFTFDGRLEKDDLGTEFSCLEDAYLDAVHSALDMSFDKLRGRGDPHRDSVEILDAKRQSLMQVPFSEVLRPKPLRYAALRDQCSEIIDLCQRELARGKRLRAEIDDELRKMEIISGAIRAALERAQRAPI